MEGQNIVLEGMAGNGSIAEVCRRRGISTTQYYNWRDRLKSSAGEIFANRKNRPNHKEERMLEQIRRMKDVIAEITAENLELKKTFGD